MSGKVMQAVLRGPGSPCMVTVKRPWRVSISIRSLGGPAAAASADGATTTDAGPDDMGTWKNNVKASDFSKTKSFRHRVSTTPRKGPKRRNVYGFLEKPTRLEI